MKRPSPLVIPAAVTVASILALTVPLPARAQKAAGGVNLFRQNPGFENSTPENNLWDGVAADGSLSGRSVSLETLSDNGLRPAAMPPSVGFGDLNGDGKPDLLTLDAAGVFRFYENVGTAGAPVFKNAEILPLFLSASPQKRDIHRGDWNSQLNRWSHARFAPRFALAPWSRGGVLDLIVGNYLGELMFIPNAGSAKQPVFRQPRVLETALLKTNAKGLLTANLLSPAAGAWTGVGKTDLILGEGTYSANAIRLFENISSTGTPQFSEERSWYLAYGDGKEGLNPCVVDFDGDGRPDLLVADRSGQVSVYLNPGANWKPGQEVPFASKISFGGSDRLPGLVSLCAADFNGDGLFDLIMGLPNGHIAVALNTGTKGQPKFGPPQNLKGEKRLPPVQLPSDWGTDTWADWGNLLGYISVVDAASDPESKPPEGTKCLKAGYLPSGNHLFGPTFEAIPAEFRNFEVKQGVQLEIGRNYTLSFKVRGNGVEKFQYILRSSLHSADEDRRVDQLERGVRKVSRFRSYAEGILEIRGEAIPSNGWTTVTKTFQFQTRGRELPDGTKANAEFRCYFRLDRADATAYLDDFQLVAK